MISSTFKEKREYYEDIIRNDSIDYELVVILFRHFEAQRW